MEAITVLDDTKTSADRWKGWYVTSLQRVERSESSQEFSQAKDAFTKQDFEKALKKVSRKIKR